MTRSAGAWRIALPAETLPAEPLPVSRGPVSLAVATGRDLLAAAGCESPRLDAELLLAEVLGVGRERLVIDRRELVAPSSWATFQQLLARRARREPIAYILGRRGFRHLELEVDPRVLIPRPETELLVEVGLSLAAGATVLDVGTGSGAVALALKDERPDLVVSGVDTSAGAIAVARANAARLRLDVSFAVGDLVAGRARCDAVVANLPYVESGAALAPEITVYEPPEALFAGTDGLDVIRRLVGSFDRPGRPSRLAWRPSLIALEIGPSQAGAVGELLARAGWGSVVVRQDLAGHDRVVVGTE